MTEIGTEEALAELAKVQQAIEPGAAADAGMKSAVEL